MNERGITLKPNSPGFSGSKSYRAVHEGVLFCWGCWPLIGVLAGEFFIGDAKGDAENVNVKSRRKFYSSQLIIY